MQPTQPTRIKTIYFDESGQTGTHLLDPEQPYFCLASSDLENEYARELLLRIFPKHAGAEVKSLSVFKRSTGRKQFLGLLNALAHIPHRICVSRLSKRFAIISKMVDNLVEPVLRAEGYDFYKNDYARKFANSATYMFDHVLERNAGEKVLASYASFARKPSSARLAKLEEELGLLLRAHVYGTDHFLSLFLTGARFFEKFHDLNDFEDSNEVHVTSVVRCMSHWQAQWDGPFSVVHDESIHFFARSQRWNLMTNPALARQVLTVGDKTLTLPIGVSNTIAASSKEWASLQICDLFAGFISRAARPDVGDRMTDFIQAAIDAGLGNVPIFPIEADFEFVSGEPERLTGPDIVDQIVTAVGKNSRGAPPD